MQPKRNPPVSAAGCPISGTPLFQGRSDARPNLAVNDPHSIPESASGMSAGEASALIPEPVGDARTHRGFYPLGLSGEAVYKVSEDSGAPPEFGGALSRAGAAAMRGKPLGFEKSPDSVKGSPLHHALLPQSRGRRAVARRKGGPGSPPST